MKNLDNYLTFDNLFTLKALFYILLFGLYEVVYKLIVINKIEGRIKKKILVEQTELVEKIKSENINENNKLKHSLDKLLSLQLQHRTEERQALMNFLSNCNQWIFNLSSIRSSHYNRLNAKELENKIESIEDTYFQSLHIERIKIILFITDEQVNIVMNQLFDSLEKYKLDMEGALTKLLLLFNEELASSYVEYILDEEGEGYLTRYRVDNASKIESLSKEFFDFNSNAFKKCMTQMENLAIVAKFYLTSS